MQNFNRPYIAKSVAEFWKRWHISLSTWFKDYLYISLGGNRSHFLIWQFNLFITFFVSGLWHGANWTYIIWGSLNGFYLICSNILDKTKLLGLLFPKKIKYPSFLNFINVTFTFFLICFSWIFFRAKGLEEAKYIALNCFRGWSEPLRYIKQNGFMAIADNTFLGINIPTIDTLSFLFSCSLIIFLLFAENKMGNNPIYSYLQRKKWQFRWAAYYFLIISIITFGVYGENQFIYFQF